jgi:bifunctional non-homologous end joining protein LigD
MLAQLLRWPAEAHVLRGDDWVFERKLDGLRGLAVRDGGTVELWSRNQLPFHHRFPQIVAALGALGADSFVMDGEIVAERDGASGFSLLQRGGEGVVTVYVAFDLLSLLGRDTTGLPLRERRDLLTRLLQGAPAVLRVAERLEGDPGELLRAACASGWEGLVAKRASSAYRSGRSPDWRKLKCSARQEVVIGGWTDPSGARSGFGALLCGYYESGKLLYAGKVGTGFDEASLRGLHAALQSIATPDSPFADAPRLRGVHWVRPLLVAEVEFSEWTADGRMRHPRFLGLRPDKEPSQVHREQPR